MCRTSSPSVWREWIEIDQELSELDKHMSPSVWREWIEIFKPLKQGELGKSPSVWREWIEISGQIKHLTMNAVSLRVEGVD